MTQTALAKASKPFRFYTRLHLQSLTGCRARTIKELLMHIKKVPGSVIYHHTHHFLQQHQFVTPEPPNDFAFWIRDALGEDRLAEQLDSVDICEFDTIRAIREKIVKIIKEYMEGKDEKWLDREAPEGEDFNFIRSISFIIPTNLEVWNLQEFRDALEQVTASSLYFHVFEARLRVQRRSNDFSLWFDHCLGDAELAKAVERLDPYTHTMEGLRKKIISLVEEKIK